tara:strand:+ start:42 stop:248 length:207 start_codon:yes stop_codon:yes gene_type:complete
MDYKQMAKNPVQYLLGLAIVGLAYMHTQAMDNMQMQIDRQAEQITLLRAENKELQTKYIELAKSINDR